MPDPTVALALLLLVVLVESSDLVRVPIGLLLAIGMLTSGADLLPVALIGATGVMIARLGLALAARTARAGSRSRSPQQEAQREALRAQLAGSSAYARITFVLAALPGVPAGFLFPLIGAMRTPLWPALTGTLVGRTPLLALTTALFAWLGGLLEDTDERAAVTLAFFAVLILVVRTVGRIDWEHRSRTGEWRMRPDESRFVQMTTVFGGSGPDPFAATFTSTSTLAEDDADVIEGELLGEEIDGDAGDTRRRELPEHGEDQPPA